MFRMIVVLFWVVFNSAAHAGPSFDPMVLKGGDILLQKTTGGQSMAVADATNSPYTHAAMVFMRKGQPFVLEAIGPVKWTPLDRWIRQGSSQHVVVLRLKDESPLANGGRTKLRDAAKAFLGYPYDLLFQWSDERIYCSELVFKAYKSALDMDIGALEPLSDFNLESPAVKMLIRERVKGQLDTAELIVSPVSLMHDSDVRMVFTNDPVLKVSDE